MRLKLVIFSLFVVILFSGLVYAEALPSETFKLPSLKIEEQEIPEGENGTLSLTGFTKALVRIHEGSRVDFNIYNPETKELMTKNSLIVDRIDQNSALISTSIDGEEFIQSTWTLGDMMQLNYTEVMLPFMFIEFQKIRNFEADGKTLKHVSLFFNVPLISDGSDIMGATVTDNTPKGGNVEKNNKAKYYILGVVALLLAGLLLLRKGSSKDDKKTVKENNSKEELHSK